MGKAKNKPVVELFRYYDSNQKWGQCDLEIICNEDNVIVIATERSDNACMSITNAAEHLIAQVIKTHGFDPNGLIWIEHYGPESYKAGKSAKVAHDYDLVNFKMNKATVCNPTWRRMNESDWSEIGLAPRK